jgi:hypothetical protein
MRQQHALLRGSQPEHEVIKMKFRNAVLAFVVAPWIALLSAAQANMPGTYQVGMIIAQAAVGGAALNCTGGTITTVGTQRIHTFTAGGTLACTGSGAANYLVVAGGAGGGSAGGGGGGAGGVLTGSVPLNASNAITVGGGGAGGVTQETIRVSVAATHHSLQRPPSQR